LYTGAGLDTSASHEGSSHNKHRAGENINGGESITTSQQDVGAVETGNSNSSASNGTGKVIVKRRVIRRFMIKDGKEVIIQEHYCEPSQEWPDVDWTSAKTYSLSGEASTDVDDRGSTPAGRGSDLGGATAAVTSSLLAFPMATSTIAASTHLVTTPTSGDVTNKFKTSLLPLLTAAPSLEFDPPETLSMTSSTSNSLFNDEDSTSKRFTSGGGEAIGGGERGYFSPRTAGGVAAERRKSQTVDGGDTLDAENQSNTLHYVMKVLHTTNKIAEINRFAHGPTDDANIVENGSEKATTETGLFANSVVTVPDKSIQSGWARR
jgi:hypothetical protein